MSATQDLIATARSVRTGDGEAVSFLDDIRAAKIRAGEDAVIRNLKRSGLVTETLPSLIDPPGEIATLRAQLAAAEELTERLRIEAQTHAQEARTQRATVHECYQTATGGTGEPGDWHGAEPVRKMAERLAAAEARAERLAGAGSVILQLYDGFKARNGHIDDAVEMAALRAALDEGESE